MLIFETPRLIVRQYTIHDADNFFSLNGDEEVMRHIRKILNKEDSDKFLQQNIDFYIANPKLGRWAVEEKSTRIFVGSFALIPLPFEDEKDKLQIGYSLLPAEWGKGYATELTAVGRDYFFDHHVFNELHGITTTANISSQKVLLKCGFAQNGTKQEGEELLQRFIYCRKQAHSINTQD
jgi:RimJ/RimL family protein N-acetyltransferase